MTSLGGGLQSRNLFRKGQRFWLSGLVVLLLFVGVVWGIRQFKERRTDLDIVTKERLVNVSQARVAIKGYDTVAYFKDRAAKKGIRKFRHKWNGAIWYFVNAEHKELFASDPIRFAPQYGGFCAQGVSLGKAWDSNPEAWKIIDNKLYLSWGKKGIEKFSKSSVVQEKADKLWKLAIGNN